MSRHKKIRFEYEAPGCCSPYMYGMGGGAGYGGGGTCGNNQVGGGIRLIYALLILIVIVLQFGRRPFPYQGGYNVGGCSETAATSDDETAAAAFGGFGYPGLGTGFPFNNESIDRSVLFIIVVFLLVLCTGCWGGGGTGYGAGGGMGFGGYGY